MKKILNFILILTIALCSTFALVACDNQEDDYTPVLSKTHAVNGFEIKTTDDFTLQTTSDGIELTSEGDNQVSFGNTYFYGQYDTGNNYYDFENITLDQYTNDIAKIENVTLATPVKNINITEKLSDIFEGKLAMNMYIIDQMQNPDGNWDYYTILCIGKGSNAFVYFSIYTSIQDTYYDDNIEKYTSIISSTKFSTPLINKSYNDSVKSYISSTMVNTGDLWNYYNLKMDVPSDYQKTEYENWYNHNYLNTPYLKEDWSSAIRMETLATFMEEAVLEDFGPKHLINFSTSDLLGFYTKTVNSEVSADRHGYCYNIYYLNSENKLSRYYFQVSTGWNEELEALGFGNYFEEQMISWMQTVEFLPQ